MNSIALLSVINRLKADRDAKLQEVARLDQEIAAIEALLTPAAPAPQAAPQPQVVAEVKAEPVVEAPKAESPVGKALSSTELAAQSTLVRREPRIDPQFEALKNRIETENFAQDLPHMPDYVVLAEAAIKRTRMTGIPTVVENSRGIRKICRAYLRGETPAFLTLLRETNRFPTAARSLLLSRLNDRVDEFANQAYAWLGQDCELPIDAQQIQDINAECKAFAEEMRRNAEQRNRAVNDAAMTDAPSAMSQKLSEVLGNAAHA